MVYTYIYESDKLIRMTVGSDVVMNFFYDHNGQSCAVKYNGTTYYYVLNLQGDVVKIVTAAGNSCGTYTYDAWGNILYASSGNLMTYNPLRYRGYVYDNETELYYCQSRYYDPEVGRFINADELMSTGQGVLGSIMFAYCLNNPVIGSDPSGKIVTILDFASFGYSIVSVALNPNDIGAWLGLAGDTLDLLPGVTGVGEIVKGLVTTDKVIDGFGDLSKAIDFGIEACNKLKTKTKGHGLEAHHIIEKRLLAHLDINVNTMLSVAVTPAEHQKFTNAWRDIFEYGMDYSSLEPEDIYQAATKIYKNYPELLKSAYETLFER